MLASILLEEIASDQRWSVAFAKSQDAQDALEKLAGEALAEHAAGHTLPL